MYTKLLLALLALPLLVDGTPTHCDRWKGSKEFRCAKDNYGADNIRIRNIVNDNISFRIGKWISECGRGGVSYSSDERALALGPRASRDEPFGEARGAACHELFIHACQQGGRPVDCVDVLTPSVN